MKVLLVDHEDSFVHNIEQALAARGARVRCVRPDADRREIVRFDPDAVVLSPGPGHPSDLRLTGLSRALLDRWSAERPFLGVCLGHQLIGAAFGARVVRARAPVHGATTRVRHDGRGLFVGVPSPTVAARYHSLVVDPASLPAELAVTARGDGGVVMGLRHTVRPIESVQFHPESFLTPDGPTMFANFLAEVRR
ncbi:MAG TPA: aminodeoxychorismate/anthranilate synthase component II [Thermoplasmata archaeon]|nr:aminodeoxychorismate/anthranilate synthase component II [Thermoplasmata archaeon]